MATKEFSIPEWLESNPDVVERHRGQLILVHPKMGVLVYDSDRVGFTKKLSMLKASTLKQCVTHDLTCDTVDPPYEPVSDPFSRSNTIYIDGGGAEWRNRRF